MTAEAIADGDVVVRREGRAGRITLNRPKALNALTQPMMAPIHKALVEWQGDARVQLVILDGAGERAFCAGGDVVELYNSRASQGSALARRFWSDEYPINALIGSYSKPIVALQDGIVMGGGIGLSGHASHRVTTERSMLAMPETTIGLIPDVGGTWLLSRAPGETGKYLGLIGHRMNAGDAIYAGFSDTCVPSARLAELVGALTETTDPVSFVLASFAVAPPAGTLAENRNEIDEAFGQPTVEAILKVLQGSGSAFAARTLKEFEARSPVALKATLAAVRRACALDRLATALEIEYRLCVRLFESGEFTEGVRALLVDKDRNPRWRASTLGEVTDADIEALFAPLPPGEDITIAAMR